MSEETPAPTPSPTPSPAPTPAPAPAAEALSPPPAASWRDGLSEELRGEAAWANYNSLDDFAKGHLETKRLASSRVPTPGDTPESIKAFADAIRPADAKIYEIPVPDGMPTDHAESFREVAHELALQPWQAKRLAEWNNGKISAALEGQSKASADEVEEFSKGYQGNYDQKLGDVQKMLPKLGVQLSDEEMGQLDHKLGSGNFLRFFFAVHDLVGDLPFAGDGDLGGGQLGGMTPQQAEETWNARVQDESWRAKADIQGSPENKEKVRLTNLITHGRMQAARRPAKAT